MTRIFIVTILLTIFSSLVFAQQPVQSLQDINWMTEEYAPFNFTEGGVLKGISVDILLEVWKKTDTAKTVKDIEVLPWARGLMYVKQKKNSCLFSTSITDERKKQFVFAGSISDNDNVILARKSKGYKINAIADLKSLVIGTVREDAGEQLLLSSGWEVANLERSSSVESLIRKLAIERMDAISYGMETSIYNMKILGIDPDKYEKIYLLRRTQLAYAFNRETNPEIIVLFQKAFDELEKDGTIEKIRAKYLKHG